MVGKLNTNDRSKLLIAFAEMLRVFSNNTRHMLFCNNVYIVYLGSFLM
jgi:hypothetical protein